MALLNCPECDNEVSDRAPNCPKCGLPVSEVIGELRAEETPEQALHTRPEAYADEHPVYREAFLKFDAIGGGFVATWSWVGFFFGLFWYLYRGMFGKAAGLFIIFLLTLGIGWFPFALYCGIWGKWDYYLLRVKGKQLW